MSKYSYECECPVCTGEMTSLQLLDTLAEMAKERGFAITGNGFPWYTVGMAKHGLPDVIFSIPDQNMALNTLNLYFDYVKQNGIILGSDKGFVESVAGVHEYGLDCFVLEMDLSYHLDQNFSAVASAIQDFYETHRLLGGDGERRIVHLMYPDRFNTLPFEEGYRFDELPQVLYGVPKDIDSMVEFSLSRGKFVRGMGDALMKEAEGKTKH
ncbi:hypothetical protein QTV49_003952 [Vibrio vulnificus]|nr:hypothetical protein [Vibrio vulnificus]